jgi:hypothetical protein
VVACAPIAGTGAGVKGGFAWGGRNGARRQAIDARQLNTIENNKG